MANKDIKFKVRKLRGTGKTYSEIREELKIKTPKSTLSGWCAGVKLPASYKEKVQKINKNNFSVVQKLGAEARLIKMTKLLEEIEIKNKPLIPFLKNKDVLRAVLAMLHLGEGAKWKSHRGLMLGSSDPDIIRLYIRLLKICYGKKNEDMRCRVSYRADQDIDELEAYWSRITNISRDNFYKTKSDPRTIGKPTKNKDYKGVCVITSSGTDIQLELESIAKIILKNI